MIFKTWFDSLKAWFKVEANGVKRYEVWFAGFVKAIVHGGISSLASVLGASFLDYSKFNLTNGLRSEFDLLLLVFAVAGGYAGYSYVQTNSVAKK